MPQVVSFLASGLLMNVVGWLSSFLSSGLLMNVVGWLSNSKFGSQFSMFFFFAGVDSLRHIILFSAAFLLRWRTPQHVVSHGNDLIAVAGGPRGPKFLVVASLGLRNT